jgi:hypothetical protein
MQMCANIQLKYISRQLPVTSSQLPVASFQLPAGASSAGSWFTGDWLRGCVFELLPAPPSGAGISRIERERRATGGESVKRVPLLPSRRFRARPLKM